jgi:hypothetical protein
MVEVTNARVVIEVMLVEGGSVIIVELRIKYAWSGQWKFQARQSPRVLPLTNMPNLMLFIVLVRLVRVPFEVGMLGLEELLLFKSYCY